MYDRIEATTRESKIEKEVCAYAVLRGWMVIKLMLCNIDSMPDRLMIRNGRVIFMELKAPHKGPTPKQAKRHREIQAQGVEVYVINDLADAQAVLV